MKRAIVTGATGFIGSWLTEELLNTGYEVTLIVRDSSKLIDNIKKNKDVVIVEKSLEYLEAKDIPDLNYDVFFNLAWAGVSSEQKNDASLQISNIKAALNALRVSKELKCKKYIATGTVAEYALTTDVMDLNARQSPNDMYGAAKVSAHYFLEVEARKLQQPFVWVVVPSTFGERRTDNNIITYTITTLLKNERPCYGNLEQMWDFLYVAEVARALRLIAENGKVDKVYGIGSGQYRPLKDYIQIIRDIINPNLSLGIGDIQSLSKQSFSSCVNIYELIKDTGFQPQVSFEDGIKKTISYWISNN